MVAVSGFVTAPTLDGVETPVEGATVSVVGTSNTATTDASGGFSVMAPMGTVLFLASADGHWGGLVAEDVPAGGKNDSDLQVIPDALVDGIAADLGTTIDTSKGLVAVNFNDGALAVGGETATISANSETSFVFDATEAPVAGNTLIAGGGGEVIFVNTDVASSVTATATSADAMPCPHAFPGAAYSVRAKVLTDIDVVCPAQ